MNYSKFRDAFIKTYRESKPKEQAVVKDALVKLSDAIDELGALAMGAVEELHETLSNGAEGLIAQLDEPPVASEPKQNYSKMYEYVSKNGTNAMKSMLGLVPVEYFTKDKTHVLKAWYDALVESQMQDFDWDKATDDPNEGEK